MNIELPIYIEQRKSHGGHYVARPLFFLAPVVREKELDRLHAKLAQDLGKHLAELGRKGRHDELAEWTFSPALRQQRLELSFVLRRRTARCRYLFVVFRQFGRRLAFTPSFPGLWFDVARKELLKDRALEVLTHHFRDREQDDEKFNPQDTSLDGTAYVSTLEISIFPPVVPPKPKVPLFLMLGEGHGPPDGAAELRRVGRCLDWQYPDELDRAFLREPELAELARLLGDRERRPVLLVGPRQVGKTALVHEYVYRQAADRESPFRDNRNVWLLSPARLISGMSYVGQWENRLLAILKEARKRGHVLYFDDLLGLFLAGQTGDSSLNVASLLKAQLEQGKVRILGEITPEALQVVRERDRGFADLFHILPVAEPTDEANLRILIGVQRQLERQHQCRFHLEVLPTVLDLQRRYNRGAAFPGKAATFLRQLAVKHRYTAPPAAVTARLARQEPVVEPVVAVSRKEALAEFHVRSGLTLTFLDRQARVERREVLEFLAKRVVGQPAALDAVADSLGIAKARLNDPGRPLGSFLFLGPTGVGKTHCAKAISAYLFGDPDRLLRFDLNEFNTPGAAARLVGTFNQPEGLLTGAVRRQPFAVVLFDEVEKAEPEVFDMLLQVLGEGRLTDALGRTADFSNAFLVLTSNLGVSEAETSLGFRRAEDGASDAVFVRAAERFFRPEFFNRLDRVLPFRRLTRPQVREITNHLIADVFQREGLLQRNCLLQVEEVALDRIVDRGFDPVLGARALKRAVERSLTDRLASRLAVLEPGGFTRVHVYPSANDLTVEVEPLEQVAATPASSAQGEAEVVLPQVRAAVRRIENAAANLRPTGPIVGGQVSPEMWRYFAVREQAQRVREIERRINDRLETSRLSSKFLPAYTKPDAPRWYKLRRWWKNRVSPLLKEMAAALDINEYLDDLAQAAIQSGEPPQDHEVVRLQQQASLLQTMADCLRTPRPERVLLWLRVHGGDAVGAFRRELGSSYAQAFPRLQLDVADRSWDDSATNPDEFWLVVQGLHVWPIVRAEVGTHLFRPPHSAIEPVQVDVLPLPDGSEPAAVIADWKTQRRKWLLALTNGQAQPADDPARLRPVLRVYSGQRIVDLRCGFLGPAAAFSDYLLSALPGPSEVAPGPSEE
jgi:ATP-dependent Clp protease ATP-binding subunit ClpA